MSWRDLIQETFSALRANKGRTFLTVLGIVIGIAAVIAMTATIEGAKAAIISRLGLNQARLVNITMYMPRDMNASDLKYMQQQLPEYELITGTTRVVGKDVTNGTKQTDALTYGCYPELFRVMGLKPLAGSLFRKSDINDARMTTVIDKKVAEKLFSTPEAAVGKSIRIENDVYTVLGVIEGMSVGNQSLYVPYTTHSMRIAGDKSMESIYGMARENTDMERLSESTKTWLMRYLNLSKKIGDGTLNVTTMQQAIKELDATVGIFQLIITAIAGISLVVGGVGIMNMMITNVTERIHEIGLRKALGARKSDITKQFLLEAVLVCLVGGVFGVAAGYGIAWGITASGINLFNNTVHFAPIISMNSLMITTLTCVGIGIIFGWWPARRAAKLDPVESLRYQ